MDAWFGTRSATCDPRAHRHAELELNLVVRGTASYLLGDRRYALTPGTLTWLFPGQDHLLVDESSDHELWWAVFRPALVARIATTEQARPLLEEDPAGQFSRRLDSDRVRRLGALFHEVRVAETVDDVLANSGLAYLLSFAWRALLDSADVVEGVDREQTGRSPSELRPTAAADDDVIVARDGP
jgi:hypothetical protein